MQDFEEEESPPRSPRNILAQVKIAYQEIVEEANRLVIAQDKYQSQVDSETFNYNAQLLPDDYQLTVQEIKLTSREPSTLERIIAAEAKEQEERLLKLKDIPECGMQITQISNPRAIKTIPGYFKNQHLAKKTKKAFKAEKNEDNMKIIKVPQSYIDQFD